MQYTWICICECGFSRRCVNKNDAQTTKVRHDLYGHNAKIKEAKNE